MSAVSMANIAIARQSESRQAASVADAIGLHATAAEGEVPERKVSENPVTGAMKVITSYIPTEVLTLYVAGIAIFLDSDPAIRNYRAAWWTFVIFLVATPLFNWLVFAIKEVARGKRLPASPASWPAWEMFIATIAFAVWAAALPTTPFTSLTWYSPRVAGYLVLVVTTLLGTISALKWPKTGMTVR
ncbi:MAG TPA: hypothetical protein VGJ62_11100 [Gemmatimonadaceae bacterium]|jgi:hypothetical protein